MLKAPRCSEDDVVEDGAALNLPNIKASRGICKAPLVSHTNTNNEATTPTAIAAALLAE